jgi:hypothetical protein
MWTQDLPTGVQVASNKEIKAQAEARKRAYEAKVRQREEAAGKRQNDNRCSNLRPRCGYRAAQRS